MRPVPVPWSAVLIFLLLASCGGDPGKAEAKAAGKKPHVPVVAVPALIRPMPRVVPGIGQIVASSTVVIRPRITGVVKTVAFIEGQDVQAGQELFTLDAQPQRDALRQAQAQLVRSQAALGQAQAVLARDQVLLAHARRQNERYLSLQQQRVVADDAAAQYATNVEALQALLRVDEAAIASARATVAGDEAAIAAQTTQVDYASIIAPVAGRVGLVGATVGNLVTANQTALLTITQTTPVHAVWSVPETWLPEIREAQAKEPLTVVATAGGNRTPLASGILEVIDQAIDPATGTIRLRATFANQDGRLWPGQAVDLRLVLGVDAQALTVPEQAVQVGQKGTFVYVVASDQTAVLRPVQVLRTGDGSAILGKGVKPGDLVVVDGHLRLTPGASVTLSEGEPPGGERKAGSGQGGAGKPARREMTDRSDPPRAGQAESEPTAKPAPATAP